MQFSRDRPGLHQKTVSRVFPGPPAPTELPAVKDHLHPVGPALPVQVKRHATLLHRDADLLQMRFQGCAPSKKASTRATACPWVSCFAGVNLALGGVRACALTSPVSQSTHSYMASVA